jgi:hypothetical protein
MKLFPLATNQTVIELNNGTEVFFSYKTPVAAFVPGTGYIRTTEKFSRTTSKHINQWLRGYAASDVDQSVIESLVGGA